MDKRIFGIETEFGISYSSPESRPLAPEEVARYLFRKVVSWGRSSNVFLTNGSRLYLDVGSHPEYATAECDDLAQLIAHDRAGELILDDLVDEAQGSMARSTSSRTTPTPQAIPTAAMRTTSYPAAENSRGWRRS
jgi:proteasome accessory factor A